VTPLKSKRLTNCTVDDDRLELRYALPVAMRAPWRALGTTLRPQQGGPWIASFRRFGRPHCVSADFRSFLPREKQSRKRLRSLSGCGRSFPSCLSPTARRPIFMVPIRERFDAKNREAGTTEEDKVMYQGALPASARTLW